LEPSEAKEMSSRPKQVNMRSVVESMLADGWTPSGDTSDLEKSTLTSPRGGRTYGLNDGIKAYLRDASWCPRCKKFCYARKGTDSWTVKTTKRVEHFDEMGRSTGHSDVPSEERMSRDTFSCSACGKQIEKPGGSSDFGKFVALALKQALLRSSLSRLS
jgi:hypothetical protein